MSVNLEEMAKLEKMIADKRKKDANEIKSNNLAEKHLKLVRKTKLIDSEYQSKPSGWMLQSLNTETQKPMDAKTASIVALLVNIVKVDLVKVCEALGWIDGQDDYPKQKHLKVAIIHVLIETAKKHNWHVIHDAGFFIFSMARIG